MDTFSQSVERAGITAKELCRLLDVPFEMAVQYLAGTRQPSVREKQVVRGLALTAKPLKTLTVEEGKRSLAYSVFEYQATVMIQPPISELVTRLVALTDGNADQAAKKLGTSTASLSRWKSGASRPRKQIEARLRLLVDGSGDLVTLAERGQTDSDLRRLEQAISGTIHALREEFHRAASVSTRHEVLDLVAALFFAHVTSTDGGARGIGEHLTSKKNSAVNAINLFMSEALARHLPKRNGASSSEGLLANHRFFAPLSEADESFARNLLRIFDRDAGAFRDLHKAGRGDLINEVFSRFMSTSFVDEKEMGQYLTPTEIVRFMVEVGFHALTQEAREKILDPRVVGEAGLVLDPSCGVGSFLAETVRFCHGLMREKYDPITAARWLHQFVGNNIVGIDKSERMIRLAMINLGLFGATAAHLRLANGLARCGPEGNLNSALDGRVQLILTNPPFGATYSGSDIASFAMGQARAKAESEVLFLERYVDWLAPGGVVVSVVPDSILVNRGAFAELRSWLRDRCNIEAVFSMPPVTFGAAGTNTKTSVLVLRKHDREISRVRAFFGEAREVGFDVVTRSGQRRRIRTTGSDLPTLLAEYRGERPPALGRHRVGADELDRWDATFHVGLPENIAAVVDDPRNTLLKVSDVATLVDERVDPRRNGGSTFSYVEISDVDTRTGLVGHKTLLAADAPSRARKLIRAGDVLVSTVRPERGSIGVTPARLDGAVCSTGFAVLRCSGIHPLVLAWLLKTELVRQQMMRNNIGIAYPAISETACLGLILPVSHSGLGILSSAAEKFAKARDNYEAAHEMFLAKVRRLDRTTLDANFDLSEFPNFVDGSEPGTVTNAA